MEFSYLLFVRLCCGVTNCCLWAIFDALDFTLGNLFSFLLWYQIKTVSVIWICSLDWKIRNVSKVQAFVNSDEPSRLIKAGNLLIILFARNTVLWHYLYSFFVFPFTLQASLIHQCITFCADYFPKLLMAVLQESSEYRVCSRWI